MRRFPMPRGRTALLALLPLATLATLTATTTFVDSLTPAAEAAERQRIEPAKHAVQFGNRVALRGQFRGASRTRVRIELSPKGRRAWRGITRTRTGPAGAYSVRVKPRTTGRWRAVLEPGDAIASDVGTAQSKGARLKVRSFTRSWAVNRHVRTGARTRIRGRVRPGGRRKVVIRGGGRRRATRTTKAGWFTARLPVGGSMKRFRVRVRATANRRSTRSRTGAGLVTVYRPASASYYGPGFYGNRTACGRTLTTSTQGVAHKSLPCGTKLSLRYRGKTVRVPVIDRGPYAAGRELDLTSATKRRLGFGSTGTVMMSR